MQLAIGYRPIGCVRVWRGCGLSRSVLSWVTVTFKARRLKPIPQTQDSCKTDNRNFRHRSDYSRRGSVYAERVCSSLAPGDTI
jgi:hypothetical protein